MSFVPKMVWSLWSKQTRDHMGKPTIPKWGWIKTYEMPKFPYTLGFMITPHVSDFGVKTEGIPCVTMSTIRRSCFENSGAGLSKSFTLLCRSSSECRTLRK